METLFQFFTELDKLKSVYRQAYLSDNSRHENSAEHSWHLAMALLTLDKELDLKVDIAKVVKMALVHDICEIGAGDISIFDPNRDQKYEDEKRYLEELSEIPLAIVPEIQMLWEEYEAQQTPESRWVKVCDRLLPFMSNVANEGRAWREQEIRKSQVLEINQFMKTQAPDIYKWMVKKIELAVSRGWLLDA